jgi:DNA-binding NarL/FixJ family response regulator
VPVLLVDDDDRVRAALAALLDQEADFDVVAQAADGVQAVAAARESGARLVLADVRMPHGGPDVVRRLVHLPHQPVVVGLSAQADATTWLRLLAAGASGYLLKGMVADDLAPLLRRCLQGQLVVAVPGAPEVVRRLLVR